MMGGQDFSQVIFGIWKTYEILLLDQNGPQLFWRRENLRKNSFKLCHVVNELDFSSSYIIEESLTSWNCLKKSFLVFKDILTVQSIEVLHVLVRMILFRFFSRGMEVLALGEHSKKPFLYIFRYNTTMNQYYVCPGRDGGVEEKRMRSRSHGVTFATIVDPP